MAISSRHRLLFRVGLWMCVQGTAAVQAAPTGVLNDTGQVRCLDATGTGLETCTEANTGDASPHPRQDGRFGRDPAALHPGQSGLTKPAGSGGHGGFAFTPLDVNGNVIPLIDNPPVPSVAPRCVWDRVTNLIWEVKTDDDGLQDKDWTYAWGSNPASNCFGGSNCNTVNYVTALNGANICPVTGADLWRLPTLRELLSIVDYDRSSSPAIDTSYFPNSVVSSADCWSADVYQPNSSKAWYLDFDNGGSNHDFQTDSNYRLRLVRSGP